METDDNTSLRVASFAYYLDTAKEKMVQRVSAQETPIPLTTQKLNNPPISIKFSKPRDTQDSTNLRVDSFSYLNPAGDNFVFEVPGPTPDPTSSFTFSREISKEGEIGVFNADKYFNMKLEYQTASKQPEKNLPRIGTVTTPSLCSKATSWNSQTALLPDLGRSESLTKHKKAIRQRIFTGFGCRGPCFSKKSVHINEIVAQGAYYGAKATRINHHHLPLVPDQDFAAKKQLIKVEDLDASRLSIEVFGSRKTSSSKGAVAANMERKLSMLTWDAIPTIPTSKHGSSTVCDDMASDASSDLFEIENISGSVYPLTSEADMMSSCMSPSSHYAPSEASIQWSVVTASAADYSAVSDYHDETSVSVAGDAMSRKITTYRGSKEAKKSGPGGLLGCKSYKAVNVAENACFKANEKGKNQGPEKSHARSRLSINVGLSP